MGRHQLERFPSVHFRAWSFLSFKWWAILFPKLRRWRCKKLHLKSMGNSHWREFNLSFSEVWVFFECLSLSPKFELIRKLICLFVLFPTFFMLKKEHEIEPDSNPWPWAWLQRQWNMTLETARPPWLGNNIFLTF